MCKEKQKKDKEKQNLKGPERKHPTALGPNKKLSITCNWKLKFLRESLSFKTKTISCSRILDHSETLTTLVERENQAPVQVVFRFGRFYMKARRRELIIKSYKDLF